MKSQPISPNEKRLRSVACQVIQAYEPEYVFHNSGGHFVERVIDRLAKHGDNYGYLSSALTIALYGCYCKVDGLSIPSLVRSQIQDRILSAYEEAKQHELV